ncbi:hypothetical protein [Kaarinaea lacus]
MITDGCRYRKINKLRDIDKPYKLAFMELFRKTNKSILLYWVIFLSITLICAQGVTLHVHTVDHDHFHGHSQHHSQQHKHDSLPDQLITAEHTHISIAHLSVDSSHSSHHDRVIFESDACPDCLLTKISSKVPLAALLSVLFILLLFGIYRRTYERRRDDNILYLFRPHFTPPLRAPPVI